MTHPMPPGEMGKPEYIAPPEWTRAMLNKIIEQNAAILRMNEDTLKWLNNPIIYLPK